MNVQGLISTRDLLQEKLSPARATDLEYEHGNTDLIRGLNILGVAGPFKALDPWIYQDAEGKKLINVSGYSAVPFGDAYPPLVEFLQAYLSNPYAIGLPQQSSSAWRAALEANLIKVLSQFAPSHADSHVFFSNSGAEANEAAVKFAKANRPKAKHIINFKRAYHGKTQMALNLTPNPSIQKDFGPFDPNVHTLPFGDLDALESKIKSLGADNVVCVILEPIQGEAGVILPPEGFLSGVGKLCSEQGIITIADEIQSGLGRTGHWFASVENGLEPDILTLAKPLGGGMTAIGATLVRRKLFKKVLGGLDCKRHSNTFGGNSMAMAVGLKSLEILLEGNLPERAKILGEQGLQRLKQISAKYPEFITEVRGKGLLMAMVFRDMTPFKLGFGLQELIAEASGLLALREMYRGGVILNLSLNSTRTLRLTPALTIPDTLFTECLDRIERVAQRNSRASKMLLHTPPRVLYQLVRFAI